MVRRTRQLFPINPIPIVFNEDGRYDFDKPWHNGVAATNEHASRGCFDDGRQREGMPRRHERPVVWGIPSARKRGFSYLLREMTGG